ncbi:MAG: hypothetical protein NPINA01_02560 [Nitrospinaceae bacterium]|nr:MAG: hypothetical protein NPINA01_02560 [Nitrospinaceae bacterium]
MIFTINKQLPRKNISKKIKWAHPLGLFCMALLIPAAAGAQQEIESSAYQETYQQEVQTPYQRESFEQNQFSYGIPSSRRPTFKNFYEAEARAYRSREEMRREKEFELQKELMETDLKQRQLSLQNQQQASSGIQGYGQGGSGPFGEFVETGSPVVGPGVSLGGSFPPGAPILVDNQNNTEVIIQITQDDEGNLIPKTGNPEGSVKSNVTVIQEGSGNSALVDIQK